MFALADNILLVCHVELRSQLCRVISILEKHCVGSDRARPALA
ncbi:MAG TPA: hypothetical protein VHT91_14055 [Kofleriaceae bacterium]|nr:hypothetical protein [Kofleriaceae bacterium]